MTARAAAARYARALFDVVRKQGDLEKADADLAALADLITDHPELARVAENPAVPVARKRAIVEALLDRLRPSPEVRNLALLMAERDRLMILPLVSAAYHTRVLDSQGVVRAELTTAAPIDESQRAALEVSLGGATGRTVRLTTKVDPDIIGGAVTRLGSVVYDASVARQLERLKSTLLQG
jgi:F-type H+-transporting ATPase subunit delta